ncbi:hypothetical protein B0I27_101158 [Arcticibacter pallidicorallinus]|uniref:Polysaccharide lyase-like protein n=2 Tax=Arcticibacter pallidicorallinus TaxID=1259464 RepID=A0A2T0UB72_9SPHI|nr:hypothetical protein B0I27_101158 [Arcticibacter pallidicorallinus]
MTMKIIIGCGLLLLSHVSTQAQVWKKMQRTLEDKANKKIEEVLDGKSSKTVNQSAGDPSAQNVPVVDEVYAFTPGSAVIFESDFKTDASGRMAKKWKSSGSGSIVSIPDIPGKWLALSEKSTYKIDSLFNTPGAFTIEFDLITRSAEAADIGSMSFGFARDNSVKNHLTDAYNGNAIANIQLHFHNREVTSSSSDTKVFNNLKYPFANYANALIHVAIEVEGENMSVYINKSKVLDTKMFKTNVPKFFYLTAPFSYDQQSKVYFGNFVMAQK